jgi:hypothetical protein
MGISLKRILVIETLKITTRDSLDEYEVLTTPL